MVTISGIGLILVQKVGHHHGQRLKPRRTHGCENVYVTAKAPLSDLVERGGNALAGGGWVEARTYFEQALRFSDSAEAWDGLSWACWWLEDGTAAIQAREHAYRLYKDAGQRRSAARMAIWLANDHLDFRAEEAVAQGWLRRATRILDDLDPAAEHGWLAALEAQFALEAGELTEAARLGTRARQLGRDLGITDLEMLGLATEGLVLVTQGELKEGMWRLDEAAAAALGGEFEEFAGVGGTCCYLIYACERVRDYDRAAQWCRNVEEFAERMRIQFLNGVCRVHYAAVLTWHGSWKQADEVLSKAIGDLAATRPPFAYEGMVRLAELRRRQGRIEEAERLFREAESHPMAALGMAELSLDRDDPRGAIPLAEQVLRHLPLANKTQRAAALELAVRAMSAAGDAHGAQVHLAELRSVAQAVPTGPLRAAVSFCDGVVAAAAGDQESAAVAFEDAVTLFAASEAPYELGRARTELARALAKLGRRDLARRQAADALVILERTGASALRMRAQQVLDRVTEKSQPAGALTRRERQVLGLIARGMRDGDIASALSLSQHTVHRHVSNIYAKLGCSTRAAAVAKVAELEML
jgi:LuxR family transcriptional regulator, maltose regulon positive regulatory protein